MRTLERNKRPFWYANYSAKSAITDSSGYETGEYTLSYGSATQAYGNVSPAQGRSSVEQFGTHLAYDRTIVLDSLPSGFTENSVIWIDAPTTGAHDYVVRGIAKSLNSVSIAIAKVDVKNVPSNN